METIKANLVNLAIVLHKPRYPENIGAAARCALNMGISKITVVSPANPDREKMLKMATHEAAGLIEDMEIHDNLDVALAPFHYIVGTTARLGRHRQALETPRELAGRIVDISQNNRVALLFGPENTGLSNEELRYCHIVTTIPTANFASLNLAQAVMIVCYEILMARMEATSRDRITPHLATSAELEGMYADLQEALLTIGFLKSGEQEYGLNQVRAFLSRVKLLSRETQLIRGLCRQLKWFKKNS
ncbi:MAG: TrmJ/YjtD family RNA methyltransferase [Desulfovibrionales bacterium]|nr:TrmJ/YjtD family RNA methyltransferase [Desulfovibrionales bacterium]